MNEDVMPPYTRSPFNQERRVNLLNTASTGFHFDKSSSHRLETHTNRKHGGRTDVRDGSNEPV